MPKVWTLRQPGSRSPAPAAGGRAARARAGARAVTAPPGPGAPTPRPGAGRGSGAAGCASARSPSATTPRAAPAPLRPRARRRFGANRSFRQGRAHTAAVAMGEDSSVRSTADKGRSERRRGSVEKTTRRGNYESGSDYVLEYGELAVLVQRAGLRQRVEQAAVKLGLRRAGAGRRGAPGPARARRQRRDRRAHARSLGEHINEHWTELVGPANRSLVHWLRRLVFRGAWLDQRVKEGELDIVFDARHPDLRLRSAGPRRRADRALPRALLGSPRLSAAS